MMQAVILRLISSTSNASTSQHSGRKKPGFRKAGNDSHDFAGTRAVAVTRNTKDFLDLGLTLINPWGFRSFCSGRKVIDLLDIVLHSVAFRVYSSCIGTSLTICYEP
jgi:hypothetical protein